MKRVFAGFFVLAVTIVALALPAPAFAQSSPVVEVGGGWNFLRLYDDEFPDDERNFPKGWYAEVAGNVTPVFAVVGQVFGNYKTLEDEDVNAQADLTLYGFMGGVRVQGPGLVSPFGEVLGGAVRSKFEVEGFGPEDTETDGMLMLGGGVTFRASPAFGVRVSGDYIRVFAEDEGANLFRAGVGIVIGFGSH